MQDLGEKLIEAGFIVNYQDQRMSTVSAERVLIEGGMRREDRRQTVDKIAAAVILQSYLDTCNNNREEINNMSDELMNEVPEEEEDNIVELTDEEGVISQFEYIMTLEHEKNSYVILMPVCDEECDHEQDDEGEVVILKIEKDPKTSEDIYVSVDDETVTQKVFDKFLATIDEDEDENEDVKTLDE